MTLTPEEYERMRQAGEFGRFARENMLRVINEIDARQREERAQRRFRRRLLPKRHAA
jgi:hypothetical protein